MSAHWSKVLPFQRQLSVEEPPFSGRDVVILQSLLQRHPGISLHVDGIFGLDTKSALEKFQADNCLLETGVLDVSLAMLLLEQLMYDGYKDDGCIPDGVKFKMHIPVYKDRNIETMGTLLSASGKVLHKFVVRSRGGTADDGIPLNQLTTNGDSVTGLMTFDLNSPCPDSKVYGPYPILRCLTGLRGNAAIGKDPEFCDGAKDSFLPNYRNGLLVHTGQWENWIQPQPMPNSKGCFHVYPEDMKIIVDLLVNESGVEVRENFFGQRWPYPFEPQGVISVEQIG